MAGRIYTITFASVSVTNAQDLITVFAGAKAFRVHSLTLGQATATGVGNLNVSLNRLTGTVTAGSGGAAPTPIAVDVNDTAAAVTAAVNNTARTTTSGSKQVIVADVYNVINGYLYLPPAEDRITVAPNQAFVVSLDSTPATAETMSGTLTIEELF